MRAGVTHLRRPGAVDAFAERGVPEVWRASIAEAIAVIDMLDARVAPIDADLVRLARGDQRAALLRTIPGVGWLLDPAPASPFVDGLHDALWVSGLALLAGAALAALLLTPGARRAAG